MNVILLMKSTGREVRRERLARKEGRVRPDIPPISHSSSVVTSVWVITHRGTWSLDRGSGARDGDSLVGEVCRKTASFGGCVRELWLARVACVVRVDAFVVRGFSAILAGSACSNCTTAFGVAAAVLGVESPRGPLRGDLAGL